MTEVRLHGCTPIGMQVVEGRLEQAAEVVEPRREQAPEKVRSRPAQNEIQTKPSFRRRSESSGLIIHSRIAGMTTGTTTQYAIPQNLPPSSRRPILRDSSLRLPAAGRYLEQAAEKILNVFTEMSHNTHLPLMRHAIKPATS